MYRDDKLNEVLERFPHMYNIDIGSNNEFLISSVLEEIKNLNQAVYELASMLDVSKANGIWLDRLGNIFGVYRESGENDDIYRINILQYWLMVSKNATPILVGDKPALRNSQAIGRVKTKLRPTVAW